MHGLCWAAVVALADAAAAPWNVGAVGAVLLARHCCLSRDSEDLIDACGTVLFSLAILLIGRALFVLVIRRSHGSLCANPVEKADLETAHAKLQQEIGRKWDGLTHDAIACVFAFGGGGS